MKEELKQEKTIKNWQLTRINSGWQMTRVEGKYIACRDLTLLEKIRYYRIMKSNIQYSKYYNNKEDNITLLKQPN